MNIEPEFTNKPIAWDSLDILTQFWILQNQPSRVFRCINKSCWKGWYGPSRPGQIDVEKCPVCDSPVEKITDILTNHGGLPHE